MAITTKDVDQEPSQLNLVNSYLYFIIFLTLYYLVCVIGPNNLMNFIANICSCMWECKSSTMMNAHPKEIQNLSSSQCDQ